MRHLGPLVFFYDYVDPASFLLELRLRRRGFVPGFDLHPLPFEVAPPPQPLLDANRGAWEDHWSRMMSEARREDIEIERPWIVPWTRKAHELALHGAENDCGGEIHEALFRAYLIERRDIGRLDVLVELAGKFGLEALKTKAVLDVDRFKDALETIRSRGIREGVARSPTLLLDGKLLDGYPTSEELNSFLSAGPADGKP